MAKKNPHPGVKALKSVLMECAIDLKANPTLAPVLEVASEELGLKYLIARAKEFLADPTEHNIKMAIALLAVNLHATRPDVKVEKAKPETLQDLLTEGLAKQPVAFTINPGGLESVLLVKDPTLGKPYDVPNTPEIGSPDVKISGEHLVGALRGGKPWERCTLCNLGILELKPDNAPKSETGFMLKCPRCGHGDSCIISVPSASEMQNAAADVCLQRVEEEAERLALPSVANPDAVHLGDTLQSDGPPHPDYTPPRSRSFLRSPMPKGF